MKRRVKQTAGLTLMELLVVIGITAFLLTITATFLTSGVTGSNRSSCQVNLYNLHQAMSQYMLDFNNMPPPFDPTLQPVSHPCQTSSGWQGSSDTSATRITPSNMGLLALYSYGFSLNDPQTRYLKGMKSFHCPEDNEVVSGQRDSLSPQCPRDLNDPTVQTRFNLDWMSYQVFDPDVAQATGNNAFLSWTYAWTRNLPPPPTISEQEFRRQLLADRNGDNIPDANWQPADNTVLTWCRFHRNRAKPLDHDNVLFLNGTVESLPKEQVCPTRGTRYGAARLPERECN